MACSFRPGCNHGGQLAGKVVVHLGPVVSDVVLPEGCMAFPLQEQVSTQPFSLDQFGAFRKDLTSTLAGLKEHLGPAFQAEGFHSEVQEGGVLELRAVLPGYGSQNLTVRLVGRSLVVKGLRADGRAVSSFQRSFGIPAAADMDRVSAVYSPTDGALAIRVPPLASAPSTGQGKANMQWALPLLESGSHTRITVSSALGGTSPTFVDELAGLVKRAVAGSWMDPVADFFGGSHPGTQEDKAASAGSPTSSPIPVLAAAREDKEGEATPGTAVANSPFGPALLLQPPDAKPFWLLGDGGAEEGSAWVEIVAPRGTAVGIPAGLTVPVYRGEEAAAGAAAEEMRLPVEVSAGCVWAEVRLSRERVLRCPMSSGSLRRVPLKASGEL